MALSVTRPVDVSLTEDLILSVIPLRQYDSAVRKLRCTLYQNTVRYPVPEDTIISCSGKRPDGTLFFYSSESDPEQLYIEDGDVVVVVTSYMTEIAGTYTLNIVLQTEDGDAAGAFGLALRIVETDTGILSVMTYQSYWTGILEGITGFYISEDGCLVLVSDDGTDGLSSDYSEYFENASAALAELLVQSYINDEGCVVYVSDDSLGLIFAVNSDQELIITYEEES